jgi:uncharacterized protein DUF4157
MGRVVRVIHEYPFEVPDFEGLISPAPAAPEEPEPAMAEAPEQASGPLPQAEPPRETVEQPAVRSERPPEPLSRRVTELPAADVPASPPALQPSSPASPPEERTSAAQARPGEETAPRSRRARLQPEETEPASPYLHRPTVEETAVRSSDQPAGETPAEPQPEEELTAPADFDRSPQAWLARLQRTAEEAAPPARLETTRPHTVPPPEAPAAPPLSESSRRFLRPLVGFDPAAVRVHRGVEADQAASAFRADAITAGDEVALAAGHEGDEPETLGLLAHELTHVARGREPRFIPPVARPSGRGVPAPAPVSEEEGEERLAQKVEAEVTRIARARPPAVVPPRASEAPPGPSPIIAPEAADPIPATPDAPPAEEPPVPARARDWGNLPAPWEPLPEWLAAPDTAAPVGDMSFGPPAAVEAPANGAGAAAQGIQRAGEERPREADPTAGPAAGPSRPPAGAPEPDLDVLARQVYAVLRRRLAAERRREG